MKNLIRKLFKKNSKEEEKKRIPVILDFGDIELRVKKESEYRSTGKTRSYQEGFIDGGSFARKLIFDKLEEVLVKHERSYIYYDEDKEGTAHVNTEDLYHDIMRAIKKEET